MILTHADIADAIAFAVCCELAEEAEETCGGEQAIVEWALARPDDDPDLEAFAGFVDALAWETAAHIENLFGWRRVA